jgi:subtilase family serine protease
MENPHMFRSLAQPIAARKGKQKQPRPSLEALEVRVVPTALPSGPLAFPSVRLLDAALAPAGSPIRAAANPTPSGGYSPAQLAQAYSFNQISFGSAKGDGSGQTIAIIDAYDDPTIAGDLATFDSTLGIPAPPSFKKVNQTGGASYPNVDPNWSLEMSLDVEWAHGMAPGANILLVEANTSSLNDLLAAVDYARNQPGVSVVSMSWGGKDFSGEANYDSQFTTPSGHAGITFVAASGDGGSSGAPAFPSVSPNVLAVGGTILQADSSGTWSSETGWAGSGGGISVYEARPGYQNGVVTQSSTGRTTPDVAYNAAMPMGIYDSFGYSGWTSVGGTSAGAPQWAALIAIADQGRALAGQSSLDGFSQTLPKLYQLPQSDFHDITSGSNGSYSAGAGYDLVTGRGSAYANLIVSALVGAPVTGTGNPPPTGTGNPPPTGTGNPPPTGTGPKAAAPASASPNPITGTTTNLSILGSDPAGESSLTYTWTVVSEPTGATVPTYSANGTNAAKNTMATFYRAGNYAFQVTMRDASGLTATSSVSVTVNQTLTSIRVSPATSTLLLGSSQQFTAATLDQFGQSMAMQPSSFTWTLGTGSVGSLSSAGLYHAPTSSTGSATVIATYKLSGSGRVTVTSRVTAPNAPTSLVATAVSKTQINLSWLESSSNVTGYWVLRSSDGGRTWSHIAQVPSTRFSDATVRSGSTYEYRVSAFNSAGSSAWTTPAIVITPKVLVGRTTPAILFGSNSGQGTTTSKASFPQVTSATVLDYFLATPSSGNSDLLRKEIANRFERLAQRGNTATTDDSPWLMPSALSSI